MMKSLSGGPARWMYSEGEKRKENTEAWISDLSADKICRAVNVKMAVFAKSIFNFPLIAIRSPEDL